VRENCRGKAEEGDGVGDGSGGGGAAVAGSGVVMGDAESDAESEGEAEGVPDDGAAPGASGVQAASTVSPTPAARKRAKVRRLVVVCPEASEGVQW